MSMVQLPSVAPCRLWHVDLGGTPAASALAALSTAEWDRAHRFVFQRDRDRYLAAHAALRSALSGHTGIDAAALDFTLNQFGKPSLVDRADVHFNLSHSQSAALIAVHDRCEVGVDIESQRAMPDADELAATYFTPDEIRSLRELAPEARERAFFVCWTRKEACLKALGVGLSLDLRMVDVGTAPADRTVSCSVDGRSRSLFVSSFAVPGRAAAAIALDTSRLSHPFMSMTHGDLEFLQ